MQKPTDTLSDIVLGMMTLNEWELTGTSLVEWIESCIELGVTTFDHADLYGDYLNEEIFGQVLKEKPSLRQEMQLVSKCGVMKISERRPANLVKHYSSSKKHIAWSVDNSLKMLHTDYLDLFLVHRPDLLMNMEELGPTLDALVESGKVLQVGVSNFTPSQFSALQAHMDQTLVTNQVHFNVVHTEPLFDGTIDQASDYGFRLMAYSPFYAGRLLKADTPITKSLVSKAEQLQENYAFGVNGVPVSWLLAHPTRPHVVVATRHLEKIREMVVAASEPLSRQDWYAMLEISRGFSVP